MKRLLITLLMLLLCLGMVTPVWAENIIPRLVDQADLLSSYEENELIDKLDAVSEKYGIDVVVVTADTLNGKTPMAYADDFYDYNGYVLDGILLLVSMEDRDWWMSTTGYGITAFTDAGLDYIAEQFLPSLSDGDYLDAFEIFADSCDAFIAQAKSGAPYDSHNLPKEPFAAAKTLMICIGIGLVVAFIATGIMRSQLNSVRSKDGAADYVKQGSLNVTQRQDLFLYREVHKREKPKSSSGSSTHRSSSGRSHGGRGGKF